MSPSSHPPYRKEEGQSLVIIAAAILGMLAFLGLAVDGGNVYLQRRNAQNAADAAGQAGTLALMQNHADPDMNLTEKQLCAIMTDYGTVRNETDPAQFQAQYTFRGVPINCSSNAEVKPWDNGGNGARAITGITAPSYISQILGRSSFRVAANAASQYGPPKSVGCCIFPVTLKDDWLEGRVDTNGAPLNPAQPRFDLSNPNDPDNPASVPANKRFTIWGDDRGTPGAQDISGGNRGWINPSCKDNRNLPDEDCSASNANTKNWVTNGYNGDIRVTDQIQGDAGVRASSLQDAAARIATNPIITIPIYHDVHNANGNGNGNGGTLYYHIVGFASFRMTSVVSTGSNKGIEGYFVNYVTVGELATSGDNYGTVTMQPVQ